MNQHEYYTTEEIPSEVQRILRIPPCSLFLRLVNPFLFTLKLMSDCDSYNKFIDQCQFQFLLGTKLLFSVNVLKQVIHVILCAFMYGCVLITLSKVTDVKMPH